MTSTAAASIELRHTDTVVTIAPQRGAIVTSMRILDRELLYMDEATLNDPSKNVRGGIPVLFPTPGKLDDDRWHFIGRGGELKQHGFARTLPWQIADRSAAETDRVRLTLESSPTTLDAYPWQFSASLTYSVRPSTLRIEFDVTNRDMTPMPFALGFHPYFHVDDKARATIATPATRAFDNLAKTVVPFNGFDFTRGEVDLHLLDHGSACAALALADRTIAIDCAPQFSRWVVWSLPGKPFICLEPWTAPGNALNSGEHLILLAPGRSQQLFVEIAAHA